MNDLTDRLSAARPTDEDLDDAFGPAARQALLERVLGQDLQPATRPTRRRLLGLAAAALLLAGALVPSALSADSAAAGEDLRALARAAGEQPILSEGGYLHVKTEAVQTNIWPFEDGRTLDTNRESWIRWDGTEYAIDTRPSEGWREYMVFPRSQEPSLNLPTPEFAASLPSDPRELRRYLDQNVSGSNSHEEAIFVAISDLARSHFLPPATLRAALEVLADVDGVKTRKIQVENRAAVEISYSRFLLGLLARDSIVLDRETAQVISERQTDPIGSYTSDTVLLEHTDEIPHHIQTQFDQYNGQRVTGP